MARLSDLRMIDLDEGGNAKGNVDQTQRMWDYADLLGWKITLVLIENDIEPATETVDALGRKKKVRGVSAFKRRKIRLPDGRVEWRTYRPKLRQALDLLANGEKDGFLVLDLDRAFRDPRDLEDLIDIVEEHGIPVESVTGSLKLDNDANITMARVLVAMANKSSRDTARRVSAARERQALAGEYGGGRRPYGFDDDGVTVRPDESKIILDCSVRVVQAAEAEESSEKGGSLRQLALQLRDKQVPTVTGAEWSAETLRDILLRPRNAGFMVFQGEEIGAAPWDAIVPVETFRAVQRILTDPNRRTGPGAAPKYLGTTLFKCGICTDADFTSPVGVEVTVGGRAPRYKCKDKAHLTRSVEHTDRLVIGTVLARLALPDAVGLLRPASPQIDAAALRAEAAAIRENLNDMAADQILGRVSKAQLHAASAIGQKRVDEIDRELHNAIVDSPLKPLIGAADIMAAWKALPLSHQRLVIDTLVTVRVMPSGKSRRTFDPTKVEILFKELRPAETDTAALTAKRTPAKPRARKAKEPATA
jgi:DNA invertase Pin-like site-specific DNA recombinase